MSRVQVLCRLGSRVIPRGGSHLDFASPNLASRTCAGRGGRVGGPACRPRMMSTAGEAAPGSASHSQAKKKGGGGGGSGILALLGLAAIGAGGYYYYDTQMGLGGGGIFPSPQTKQDGKNTETSAAAAADSSTIPSPLALHPPPSSSSDSVPLAKPSSPHLSPREDLLNRQAEMKAQLEELRKKGKKGDPIVDLQKKEIKDDLKIVAKLLKQLEKGA